MSELKKQSFDRQHLEMTGEEKESRTIDAETDSGIYDPLATSEVTTDANRTRNADRDAETDSGIYDPLATSEVTTDANRTRNADRVRIPQCISDHKRKIQHTYSIIATIAIIVLIVMLVTKINCGIDDPSATSEVMTDANGTRNADSGKENRSCSVCPRTWLPYKDKCYWISISIQSWTRSYKDCVAKGSQLLVISNTEEQKYIQDIIKNKSTSIAWIGLIVKLPEEKWMWINGSLNQMLPQRLTAECGVIGKKGIGSDMCNTELNWICQKPSVFI